MEKMGINDFLSRDDLFERLIDLALDYDRVKFDLCYDFIVYLLDFLDQEIVRDDGTVIKLNYPLSPINFGLIAASAALNIFRNYPILKPQKRISPYLFEKSGCKFMFYDYPVSLSSLIYKNNSYGNYLEELALADYDLADFFGDIEVMNLWDPEEVKDERSLCFLRYQKEATIFIFSRQIILKN
ncbi:MAG: hypothetical protein QY321_01780 [Patescibacteria group bacterium]|nr:MAG: hypothetical protein QY321_01780 [Patescibacteria group bacterium]